MPSVPDPVQYWDFDLTTDETLDEETCIEEVGRLFEQAVQRQLVSDVPVGSYLSGGIDSGSITSIAARNIDQLHSFTCGFDMSSATGLELSCDERRQAEFLANLNKTNHYEVVLKAGDMERAKAPCLASRRFKCGQSYPNFMPHCYRVISSKGLSGQGMSLPDILAILYGGER